jgi:hypothetical protein
VIKKLILAFLVLVAGTVAQQTGGGGGSGGGGGGTYTGTAPVVVTGTVISCPSCPNNTLSNLGTTAINVPLNPGAAGLGLGTTTPFSSISLFQVANTQSATVANFDCTSNTANTGNIINLQGEPVGGGTSVWSVDCVTGNITGAGNEVLQGNITSDGTAGIAAANGPIASGTQGTLGTVLAGVTGAWGAVEASTAGVPTAGYAYIRADSTSNHLLFSINGSAETNLNGLPTCADTSASATAQSCTLSGSASLATNFCFAYTTTTANTGALTVAINGGSALTVQKWLSTALAAGDIPANKPVVTCYDGTNLDIQTIGNAPSGGSGGTAPVFFSSGGNLSTTVTQYWGTSVAPATTVTGATGLIAPRNATLANLNCAIGSAVASGASYTFTVYVNGATTTSTCAIAGPSAVTCSDTTHSPTITAGQLFAVQSVPSSGTAPAARGANCSVTFQ